MNIVRAQNQPVSSARVRTGVILPVGWACLPSAHHYGEDRLLAQKTVGSSLDSCAVVAGTVTRKCHSPESRCEDSRLCAVPRILATGDTPDAFKVFETLRGP